MATKKANYQFKTTNIRGKQYVEVNERIKFFRQEEQYNGWSITTNIEHINDNEVVMCTSILDTNGNVISTGHAHEVKGSTNINKTSHIENCETSAVGRALAMLGIGIDTSIASANEVETAIAQQAAPEPVPVNTRVKPKSSKEVMDAAVAYVKGSTNKQEAYDAILKKYGDTLTQTQKNNLKKFV